MKPPSNPTDQELLKVFKAAGLVDFMQYLQSGRSIIWINFKAGVAKGLGMTIGMTLVLGLLIWVLTLLVDLPLVGEYFQEAKEYVTNYVEKMDYKSELEEMNQQLEEINRNLRK